MKPGGKSRLLYSSAASGRPGAAKLSRFINRKTSLNIMSTEDAVLLCFIMMPGSQKWNLLLMKTVGSRLPLFTYLESKQVKGSADFLGVNNYNSGYIKDNPSSLKQELRDWNADTAAEIFLNLDTASANEFPIEPWGLQQVLEYFKKVYGNPPIYVHENGQVTPSSSSLEDAARVKYLQAYIGSMLDAVRNESNTRGYFTWSFLDLFELLGGYEWSYGLYYVDRDDPGLKRYPKLSAHWYSRFLKGRSVRSVNEAFKLEKNLSTLPYGQYFQ